MFIHVWIYSCVKNILSDLNYFLLCFMPLFCHCCCCCCFYHRSFPFAGMEFSSECFCGHAVTASRAPEKGLCNMTCSGNRAEICGGAPYISIYQIKSPAEDRPLKGGGAYKGIISKRYSKCIREIWSLQNWKSYTSQSHIKKNVSENSHAPRWP